MKREEIKNLIPRGAVGKIAKDTGLSYQVINNYLRGVSYNYTAELACLEFINKVVVPKKELEQRILKVM